MIATAETTRRRSTIPAELRPAQVVAIIDSLRREELPARPPRPSVAFVGR